ncbi:MAG: hypothetical protein AVDCRST_MAG64-3331, partial [uncultured Phycisphaerae bacterium]
ELPSFHRRGRAGRRGRRGRVRAGGGRRGQARRGQGRRRVVPRRVLQVQEGRQAGADQGRRGELRRVEGPDSGDRVAEVGHEREPGEARQGVHALLRADVQDREGPRRLPRPRGPQEVRRRPRARAGRRVRRRLLVEGV